MRNLISRGHNVGGGLVSPDGNYFFLSIPKNASVFISSVLRQNDWNYSDLSVYSGPNVFCVIRDPVERWISGMATYIASKNNFDTNNLVNFFQKKLIEKKYVEKLKTTYRLDYLLLQAITL